MCDIYVDKCKVCGAEWDMHLADFDTGRDEVEVYCGEHVPSGMHDGVMWRCRDMVTQKWMRVFVRFLTDNAKTNKEGNHPNSYFVQNLNAPEGTLAVSDARVRRRRADVGRVGTRPNRRSNGRTSRKGKVGR